MGRLEKIVVLTVVFLIAVILAVSVYDPSHAAGVGDDPGGSGASNPSGSGDELEVARRNGSEIEEQEGGLEGSLSGFPEGNDPAFDGLEPLDGEGDPDEGTTGELDPTPSGSDADPAPFENPDRGNGTRTPGGSGRRDSGSDNRGTDNRGALLDASVQLNGRPPAGSILKTLSGLEGVEIAPGVVSEDYYTYAWKRGDELSAVARRYYRSVAHVGLLRMSNEGVDFTALTAGSKILIPVFGGETSRSEDRLDGFYEVVDGDNLSRIAREHYGDGNLYPILVDANRDLIESADELRVGMRIRIPQR